MKNTGRIWITALIIQPIIFAFIIPDYWFLIIPIEIIGSIPGILTFGLLLYAIDGVRIPLQLKWIMVLSGAIALAFFCSWVFCTFLSESYILKDKVVYLPAPISALLAVLINAQSINKQLKNEAKITKDLESSIFNA